MDITVNPLSKQSIVKAIVQLKMYKKRLEAIPNEIVMRVTMELVKIAEQQAPPDAKGLVWPIIDAETGKGALVADGQVEFIEFGTGVVGAKDHDSINEEWLTSLPPPYNIGYDTGPAIIHTAQGCYWYYRSPDGDEYSDPVKSKNGDLWKTSGRPADPFLWRSVQELLTEYKEIVKAVRRGIR
jgi:hypothetical protein